MQGDEGMKERILIVDDQLGIRLLLKEILQKEGYSTFQAANGYQAIEITKKENPDLVLLDMRLPEMNGIEILQELKKISPDIRVIIMTAYGEQELIDTAKNIGILDYITKPFEIEEIRRIVEEKIKAN